MSDALRVEGDTRLAATLHVAAGRVRDMSDPGDATARFVAGRGRSDAPVRTGRLSSSIRSSASATDAEATSSLAYANRTHWGYARYHQRSQPFLASVVWDNGRLILSNYEKRVDVVLAGVKGA
jgi:hypothetical protein